MAKDTTRVLDPAAMERLRAMVGGDVVFLRELIDTFLAEAFQLLADMRRSVEGGEAAGLRLAAHSLKSNSANFGATALSDLCRELEKMGKDGTLAGAAELVGYADAEYAKAKAALKIVREAL